MKRSWIWTGLALASAAGGAACGGDAFVLGAADGGGGPADASGATDAGVPGPDGSPGPRPGKDGSVQGGDGAVARSDGGAPVPTGACGNLSCAAVEVCCVYTPGADGGAADYACALPLTCPAAGSGQQRAELACTSTADCAPIVCCIQRLTTGDDRSRCAATCTGNEVQFCDPGAADAGCPASAPCSTNNIADWNLPPTFGTCGGRSVP